MRWLDAEDLYYLVVVSLMRLAGWSRSAGVSDALANGVARIAWRFPSAKRRRLVSRIAACFDRATPKERRAIVQGTYRTFWQDAFALADARPGAARRTPVDGRQHLQGALAAGRGAILLESSFFGRRNLARIILHAAGISIVPVHASDHLAGFWSKHDTRVRRAVIRPFLERCERQAVQDILYISRDDPSLAFTRQLMNVLQGNRVLCLSGEGRIGKREVPVQFLGEERTFVTGAMSLAKHSGAPLLPFFCWRDDEGGMKLAIEPPLDLRGGARAAESAAAAYAQLLETYVRRYPAEYWGWHV